MILRHIKKLVFAVITMGIFAHGGSVYAAPTTKDMIINLCNKTMTSKMLHEYVRERLKLRVKYWQEQLQQFQVVKNVGRDAVVALLHRSNEFRVRQLVQW